MKNQSTLQHPPYSPGLATAGVYLFARMKSAWKRQRFCDVADIKNVMEELKRLSQNGFQDYFQHIHRLQRNFLGQTVALRVKLFQRFGS
jgi:hypothetical protein